MRKIYHIHKKHNNHKKHIKFIDKYIKSKKNGKTFVLIFMEGCGPCNATRPEWNKLGNVLHPHFLNNNDLLITDVDHESAEMFDSIDSPSSFPTMLFVTKNGKVVENYDDSDLSNKDRSIDSFVEWIKEKTGHKNISYKEYLGGKKEKKTLKKGSLKRRKRENEKTRKRRK
jgi:thiol-disulfide isomerase/thioredoxin